MCDLHADSRRNRPLYRRLATRAHVHPCYWWVLGLRVLAAEVYGVHRAARPPSADSDTWAKYQQLRLDMTYEEAAAVLGEGMRVRLNQGDNDMRPDLEACNGDDMVGVHVFNRLTVNRVAVKWALIRGHEFRDPPREPEKAWWERWLERFE